MRSVPRMLLLFPLSVICLPSSAQVVHFAVVARDIDPLVIGVHDTGRYTGESPALHAWFDKLASGKGLCCSFADGVKVEVDEWDNLGSSANGGSGYRVLLNGQWLEVPQAALVTEPNKAGAAYVWPYQDAGGKTQIRCFIPGAGT